MMRIDLQPRWKEELVASCPMGTLVLELTMGKLHVYFPDETLWAASAPEWAKPLRADFLAACESWSKSQGIPMTVTDHTFVYALTDPA